MARSLVSLADLLTVLDSVAASERPAVAKAFGLGYRAEPAVGRADNAGAPVMAAAAEPQVPAQAPPPSPEQPPAVAPVFWRVATQLTTPQEPPLVPAWLHAQSLGDARFYLPASDAAPPSAPPLLSRARFSRFLKESLSVQRRRGEPDLQRLAQALARRQALSRWPQRRQLRWPAQVRAVVDGAEVLRPFQHDVAGVLAQMRRQLGSRLAVLTVNGEPPSGAGDRTMACPADGTPTLVLSDAGALSGQGGAAERWSTAARRLQQSGRKPMLLTPVKPGPLALGGAPWQVCELEGQGGVRRHTSPGLSARSAPPGNHDDKTMDSLAPSARWLRATLFGHSYVTPPLLRGLRRLLRRHGLGGGLGDELAVWHDEAVYANANACVVLSSHREVVREDFLQLPAQVQCGVVALHLDHLQHQSPLVRAEYVRHLSAAWSDEGPTGERLAAELQAAEALAARAAAWLLRGQDTTVAQDLTEYLARLGSRSGELVGASEPLRAAWALAQQDALRAGDLDLAPGVDAEQIAWVLGTEFPCSHQLALVGGRDEVGRPCSRVVCERVDALSSRGLVLAGPVPGAPFVRLTPLGMDDPTALLSRVISWWQRFRGAGASAAPRLNLGDAWARPALAQLQRLDGEPERVMLEWLAWWRAAQRGQPSRPREPDDPWRQDVLGLASVLWRQLPRPWLLEQGFDLPDESADRRNLRPDQSAVLDPAWRHEVQAGDTQVILEALERPAWADELWRDGALLWARGLDGRRFVWMPRADWAVQHVDGSRDMFRLPHGFWWDYDAEALPCWFDQGERLRRPLWAARHGVDDHGYWAEFDLPPHPDHRAGLTPLEVMGDVRITQRMRFIPPGRFWMGSPQAEEGRLDDETLHPVTLTRGHWLADTACTQGLWRAVMGTLPDGQPEQQDDLPVVGVSHDDIHLQFLPALARLVPGLDPRLPSEAEWEYAARAGTATAYPWDDAPDPKQMNFGGYAKQGAGRPVPVRQFSANPWGLWQMHGNVWEWCSDARVVYPVEDVLDPRAETGAGRVLRGGSWIRDARYCRSAHRDASVPGGRLDFMGFRLARGLPEAGRAKPGGGRGAPALPAEPARGLQPGGGASGSPAGRPATGSGKVRPMPKK